jgi:uncharacterized protein with HEPN domain
MVNERDQAYMHHMIDAVEAIATFMNGVDYLEFVEDAKIHSAVVRQLEIIGEAAKHFSDELKRTSKKIPWKEVIGMRDKLIHHYMDVDLEAVYLTATRDIQPLKEALKECL